MSHHRDFWSQDRTTIHQKSGWFGKQPTLQKVIYTLLLMFIICWGFYLGMSYASAIAPDLEFETLDGFEWKQLAEVEDNEVVHRLTGVEVALLVGSDKRPEETKYRTDTIILAFYNWDTDELKMLSIPRDSYVQFPGKSTKTKINEAYFYGGVALLESVIEYTFGIEVDHCVEIDFAGFLQLIDALQGVEIDVPQRMYKPTEEINIQKGLQTLYGYDALGFVRFRDLPMGDIDRIANQQAFLRALAKKISESSLWKAPELVKIAWQHVTTNYELSEALNLGMVLYQTDLLNIPMYSLPGAGLYMLKGSVWVNFWVLNKKGTIDVISEITGGEIGTFHIIGDEGKGVPTPPASAKEKEDDDIDDPDEEGADPGNEEPAEDGEPVEGEDPGAGQDPSAEGQQETDPPTGQPEDTPQQETPVIPEPGDPI